MGFLDRAIKRGVNRVVNNAVDSAVDNAVEKVVVPKVNQTVNQTAESINQSVSQQQHTAQTQSTANQAEVQQAANTLGSLFGNLQGAAPSFANEAAKNMKICPSCGEGTTSDKKFCPSCGAKLPETTVAQGAVCTSCGKQNSVGTKFCSDCGAKLPSAVAEEQAAQANEERVMQEWDEKLSAYPKWNGGGHDLVIEQQDWAIKFAARMRDSACAQNAVNQYCALLQQNGFRPAGQYQDPCHLYKKVNGVCYHVDTEHCFDGDSDYPKLYFNNEEPSGGFDYVKPEPKKSSSIFDLFK